MNKRGLIGKIILGVLLVLVIAVIITGVYLYNFHVFKEVRVCIGEGQNTTIPCMSRDDCMNTFNISLDELGEAPAFVEEKAGEVLDKTVYCEDTCFVREVRGINFEGGGVEEISECLESEEEIVMQIKGKEGIEIYNWMKSQDI